MIAGSHVKRPYANTLTPTGWQQTLKWDGRTVSLFGEVTVEMDFISKPATPTTNREQWQRYVFSDSYVLVKEAVVCGL